MEQPYSESDAIMIKENSIDNGRLSGLRTRALDLARVAQNRTQQNPWIAIAAAGAGALAIGFLVGRMLKKSDQYPNEEYPSGYDE